MSVPQNRFEILAKIYFHFLKFQLLLKLLRISIGVDSALVVSLVSLMDSSVLLYLV